MGEVIEQKTVLAQASEDAMVVDTMGGRMQVRWDETAQATPHGQIAFFAQFLAAAGVFDRWVSAALHWCDGTAVGALRPSSTCASGAVNPTCCVGASRRTSR